MTDEVPVKNDFPNLSNKEGVLTYLKPMLESGMSDCEIMEKLGCSEDAIYETIEGAGYKIIYKTTVKVQRKTRNEFKEELLENLKIHLRNGDIVKYYDHKNKWELTFGFVYIEFGSIRVYPIGDNDCSNYMNVSERLFNISDIEKKKNGKEEPYFQVVFNFFDANGSPIIREKVEDRLNLGPIYEKIKNSKFLTGIKPSEPTYEKYPIDIIPIFYSSGYYGKMLTRRSFNSVLTEYIRDKTGGQKKTAYKKKIEVKE